MEQYISKAAVKAEIEGLKRNTFTNFDEGVNAAAQILLDFLDALEVKEVDLEKEINTWFDYGFPNDDKLLDYIKETAKHFFELGLKTQKQETELSKVKGFLVRDKDDYTAIYAEKPHRGKTEWVNGNGSCLMTINDARLVPDIEFKDEPVEVEVTLKRLNTEE